MNTLQRLPWLIVSAWLLAAAAFAETGPARLVADLAPGSEPNQGPRFTSGFTRLGSRSVFLRSEPEAGMTLWVTDGTVEGTSPLGVLCPPCSYAEAVGSNGSVAFYQVRADHPYRSAIWRTDGTPAGTFLLTDSTLTVSGLPRSTGGLLYFIACTAELGCELWASDGSRAGTALVGEIVPGPEHGGIERLAVTGNRAFLIVNLPGEPAALWVADGRILRRLRTTPEADYLAAEAGRAFFVAEANGLELWASDGTAAGTRPVTDFAPRDPFFSPPTYTLWPLTLLGGRAWFFADDGAHGFELWSAGLRPQGLRRVSNLRNRAAQVTEVAKAGDRIVFVVSQFPEGPRLWSSRGDLRSSARLAGCPGGCPVPVSPLTPLDPRRIVFYGHGREGGGIWVTDGTGAGTRLLQRTRRNELSQAVSLGGRALIEITDEYETGELWITDGTAAGTRFVTTGGPGWSHYFGWGGQLQAGMANGVAVFPGRTGELYEESLWRSDGSPAGSWLLLGSGVRRGTRFQNLTPLRDGLLVQTCAPKDSDPFESTEMRFVRGTETTLLLAADHCPYLMPVGLGDVALFHRGDDLWRTDGTPEGTALLLPGSPAAGYPAALARFGEEAVIWVFIPGDGVSRSELWLTDGTPEGTRKHLDLPDVKSMSGLTAAGGRLLFFNYVGSGDGAGQQPWVSDGTPAGTHPLTGAIGYTADQLFIDVGGRVYFPFGELGGPLAIWGTDGTAAGTGPAVTADSGAIEPEGLSASGGRLYFAAPRTSDPDGRLQPWVSDGTDGGTELLADVEVGEPIFAPLDRSPFVELDGRVWFAASDLQHGDELWSTDGTPEGTARLLDIAPGLLGSHPRGLTVWNGGLWFRARGAAHGMELWTSDGTVEGTRLVHDIAPGPLWSSPGGLPYWWGTPVDLTVTEAGLYFPANDGEHGRELWVVSEAGLSSQHKRWKDRACRTD
jgi:ELWxxDGT repeat protein